MYPFGKLSSITLLTVHMFIQMKKSLVNYKCILQVVGQQYVYSHLDKYSSVVIQRAIMKNKPVEGKYESCKAT